MKTREQRRQRRPLGSVFVGQAPQKHSLAGAASCLLHNMVAPLAKKACQMGSKYTCQIWRKKWQKTAKKRTKLTVNHRNSTRFGQLGCFSGVLARAGHFKGLQHDVTSQARANTEFSPKFSETARKTA